MLPSFRHLAFFSKSDLCLFFFPPRGDKKKGKTKKGSKNPLVPRTIEANRWFGRPFGSRLVLLRARRCEWGLLDRVLRANPNGASTVSSGGLSSRIVRHLHRRFISCRFPPPPSEETWQPPQRSTRPVSLSPVSVFATFLHHIRAKRAECFCSRLLWRRAEAKRRQAVEAWLPASIPLPPTEPLLCSQRGFYFPPLVSIYTFLSWNITWVMSYALFCLTPSLCCDCFCLLFLGCFKLS